ncbi:MULTISPECIES: aspartate aminotransferase family protein [unclassified Streptomyces]|uniref:aspartate aminotransferase family protein n=1 Tax=unclassified Streptomyces TaxID=2593676 RepID=UPI0037A658CA
MTSTPPELAEPFLRNVLGTFGIDVKYSRAQGNTLIRQEADGTEVPVLDMVGGYGSLIFGHHHPGIVAAAMAHLESRTPILSQFSQQPVASEVAARLNAIARRELEPDQTYSCTFANSGAEAIEVAVKHAELDRVLRLRGLLGELEQSTEAVTAAGAAGTPVAGGEELDSLLARAADANAQTLGRPPLFLALQGGFHGKLMGSVQLTHNPDFRTPFQGLAAQCRFVPVGDAQALRETVNAERAVLLEPVIADGVISLREREFPVFTAFLLEPIQGEGGVRVLTKEFARVIQDVCGEIDCSIVVDEIQTGVGRTGAFFASSHIDLHGDFYALAKSLSGGITKTAVVLVRESRYRREFELLHSSTFAKDSFSSAVALKVLDMLEADDGRAYRLASERGERLLGMLRRVQSDFPDVVADVRGTGLFTGLEFADQSAAASAVIRDRFLAGTFGYALAGYLLHRHGIRVLPTASATSTLRFQPSVYVTDAEIDRLEAALRTLAGILRAQDAVHLVQFLTGTPQAVADDEARDFGVPAAPAAEVDPSTTVAYVGHLADVAALRGIDPSLAVLEDEALEGLVARWAPAPAMTPLAPAACVSPEGEEVQVVIYPLLLSAGSVRGMAAAGALDALREHLRTIAGAGHQRVVVDPLLAEVLDGVPAGAGGADPLAWLHQAAALDQKFTWPPRH